MKTEKSTLNKLHKDVETINRLLKPSVPSVVEQMECIRRQHLEISCAFTMPAAVAQIQEIADANRHLQNLITQITSAGRVAKNHVATHQSWVEQIKSIQSDFSYFSQLQTTTILALHDSSRRIAAAERLTATIDIVAIASRFRIEIPSVLGLKDSIDHVVASYGTLARSLQDISAVTSLPAFVLPGASREIYTTSFALETLHTSEERNEEKAETEIALVSEAELETSGCIALLQQVDPRLARPYIGARNALNGNNADRERHILSSLRELWNHLFRQLAPDESVAAWIQAIAKEGDLLHNGKPTRRAKILYVCRELNNDPLTEFVIHDTQALMKLLELFNRVHELESSLTDRQLRAIVLKTDSWLMYILQIYLK